MTTVEPRHFRRLALIAAALPAVYYVAGPLVLVLRGQPFDESDGPAVSVSGACFYIVLAVALCAWTAAPYLIASCHTEELRNGRAAAIAGITVTGAVWAQAFASVWWSLQNDGRGGADIGTGCLIGVSPLIAGAAMAFFGRRVPRQTRP